MKKYFLPGYLEIENKTQFKNFGDTSRIISPNETLKKIKPLIDKLGITRIADLTDLDILSIPIYVTINPKKDIQHNLCSISAGKAHKHLHSKVSAIMETIERYSASYCDEKPVFDSYNNLKRNASIINPRSCNTLKILNYNDDLPIEWLPCHSFFEGKKVLLPARCVLFPYFPSKNCPDQLSGGTTNGLASGNSFYEAALHALYELIERDALLHAYYFPEKTKSVLKDSISDPGLLSLIEIYGKNNMSVYIKEISSDIGIPTFLTHIDDPITNDPFLLVEGSGTHLSKNIALSRSLTECAQNRIIYLSGQRETLNDYDIRNINYRQRFKKRPLFHSDKTNPTDYKNIHDIRLKSVEDSLYYTLDQISNAGIKDAFIYNLSKKTINIPVVRVIIPELEIGSSGGSTFGTRIRKKLKGEKKYSNE